MYKETSQRETLVAVLCVQERKLQELVQQEKERSHRPLL